MREKGKTKKIKGYKEVVTYGNFPYTIPVTDARGITKEVEFVATLGVYLGNKEIEMAPYMISCKHENCKENKMNERVLTFDCEECGGVWPGKADQPYWTPFMHQEHICFECYEDMMLQ
jgi:hypothetical protein